MIPVGNGGDSNRSVVRLQPILQHQRFNLALPWPLIGSVNEASPCRVLFNVIPLLTIALTGEQEMVKEFFSPKACS